MKRTSQAKAQPGIYKIARAASLIGLFVLLLTSLFFPVLAAGAALAITGTMGGVGKEGSGPDEHRVPSVTEMITLLDSSRYPFTTLMDRLRSGPRPKQVKHLWPEVSPFPRTTQVNGATTAGTAGNSKDIVVDDVSFMALDDIMIAPDNATNPDVMILITGIDTSTKTITVYALPVSTGDNPYTMDSFGTVPAFADNEALYWVDNVKSEEDDASTSKTIQPAYKFNYVHTNDLVIRWSDHKARSQNYGPQDRARYRRDQYREFRRSREYRFLFSPAPAKFVKGGKDTWVMGGVKYYLTRTSTLVAPGGVPSESGIVDFAYEAFDDNGSEMKLLMGGTQFMKAVDKSASSDLFTRRSERVAGLVIETLICRKGRLATIYNPSFDEQGYSANAMVLDLNYLEKLDYQPMERRVANLKESGNMTDAEQEQLIEKTTLCVKGGGTFHRWCSLG